MYTLYKPYRANSYKNNDLLLMHAVVTEEGIWDTEASDRDSEASDQETETSDRDSEASERDTEASDRDSEASDQYPEASDASYLQTGPARQYNDGGKRHSQRSLLTSTSSRSSSSREPSRTISAMAPEGDVLAFVFVVVVPPAWLLIPRPDDRSRARDEAASLLILKTVLDGGG